MNYVAIISRMESRPRFFLALVRAGLKYASAYFLMTAATSASISGWTRVRRSSMA